MALDFPDSPSDGQVFGIFTFDATASAWRVQNATTPFISVHAMLVAGGGSPARSGSWYSSGGGAGGFLEQSLSLASGAYTVTVGAGGAAGSGTYSSGNDGADSIFATLTANGGGASGTANNPGGVGNTGGSAGGSGYNQGSETASDGSGQGCNGGRGFNGNALTGGGGGASEGGNDRDGSWYGVGGHGMPTRIISTSTATSESVGEVATYGPIGVDQVWFAGGGGGTISTSSSVRQGGLGGGGNGSRQGSTPESGVVNTGGGGGGCWTYQAGITGGSGVVIIRLATNVSVTVSAGLTYTTDTTESDSIAYIFKSGTGTVTLG